MAGKKASISINLLADATKAKAGFSEAEKAAGKFDTQLGNVAKTAINAFATREIVNFAGSAINQASDLAESANAVDVAFGDAADRILKLGENASTAVGLSATDFNQFAVQFSGFAKQLTSDEQDIVDVTEEISGRVADFASVMNLDVPDAASKFQSALSGSAEVLRPYGIDVSDAAIKQQLLTDGLWDGEGALTESEKVMGRYRAIMEQTEQMAGDFANTSDGLANSQRILKADIENAKATIGEAMIPALESLMGVAKPLLEAFTALPEGVQQFGVLSLGAVGGAKAFSGVLQGLGGNAKFANKMAFGLTGTLGVLLVQFEAIQKHEERVAGGATSMADALEQSGGVLDEHAENLLRTKMSTGDLGDAIELLNVDLDDMIDAASGDADAIDRVRKATEKATPQGIDLGYAIRDLTGFMSDEEEAARLVRDTMKGYREEVEQTTRDQHRLSENVELSTAEMRRFMDIIEYDNVYNFATEIDALKDDLYEAAGGMSELRKETFKTDTEMSRLFGRLHDDQAVADFLEDIENANDAMREAAEGSSEFEQAERDRLFALEDLIEAHSLLDSAFGKELLPLIDTGDVDALEAKILEILGLIGTIAPNIQTAIDAGSLGLGVMEAGTIAYKESTYQAGQAARDGMTTVNVYPPAGSSPEEIANTIYSAADAGAFSSAVPMPTTSGYRN